MWLLIYRTLSQNTNVCFYRTTATNTSVINCRIPGYICATQVRGSPFPYSAYVLLGSRRATQSIRAIEPISIFSFTWPGTAKRFETRSRTALSFSVAGGTRDRSERVYALTNDASCRLAASETETRSPSRYLGASSRSREYMDSAFVRSSIRSPVRCGSQTEVIRLA